MDDKIDKDGGNVLYQMQNLSNPLRIVSSTQIQSDNLQYLGKQQ